MYAAIEWGWILGIAIGIAWFCSIAAYLISIKLLNDRLRFLFEQFKRRFPNRCFFCSYHYHCLHEPPPPHNCAEWTTSSPKAW